MPFLRTLEVLRSCNYSGLYLAQMYRSYLVALYVPKLALRSNVIRRTPLLVGWKTGSDIFLDLLEVPSN